MNFYRPEKQYNAVTHRNKVLNGTRITILNEDKGWSDLQNEPISRSAY